jgi:c-di-GMP-related signal transduction protein
LELASIIKLDVLALGPEELAEAVKHCLAFGVQLVAEKVETRAQLAVCHDLSFDLFQGYLLARPDTVEGQALSPNRLTCLRVLEKLCDPTTSAADIDDIVRADSALSYRFLRAAGAGAARGMFRRLRSVREAVVLLGERRLRAWVMLMLLADAHDGSDEQLIMALTRARMAEQMAVALGSHLADAAFTVGLISSLDLLLQAPIAVLVKELSLAAELEDALLTRSGLLGGILSDVLAWEVGAEAFLGCSGLAPAQVERCYLQAVAWASEVCGVVDVAS